MGKKYHKKWLVILGDHHTPFELCKLKTKHVITSHIFRQWNYMYFINIFLKVLDLLKLSDILVSFSFNLSTMWKTNLNLFLKWFSKHELSLWNLRDLKLYRLITNQPYSNWCNMQLYVFHKNIEYTT